MATMVYENLVFPSATSLELNLHRSPNSGGATFHKEKSTDFARSLLRMTPAATNVAVKFFSVSGSGPYHEELYSALLSGLCQGSVTSVAVYSGLYYDLVLPKLSASSDLTSITNGPTVTCMPFVFLAYFNSATLVALDIEGLAESDWHYLLHGDYENCPAVYTSLKSLTLDITDVPYSSAWAAVEDAAPFPVLTTLSICGDYPFDDDSVFRENGGTLMNLRLPFSAIARNVLGRFKVLQRDGVTRMNHVYINNVSDDSTIESLTGSTYLLTGEQISRISEVALSLHLGNNTAAYGLVYAISDGFGMSVLQHLELANVTSNVGRIFELVDALPSLVSLTSMLGDIGQGIEEIPEKQQPACLRSKCYPLSESFKRLRVPYSNGASTKNIAYAGMLLAVVCPNFGCVEVSPRLRYRFNREIAWTAFNDTFKPYADCICRLIYKD